jgi:hypothetical protein
MADWKRGWISWKPETSCQPSPFAASSSPSTSVARYPHATGSMPPPAGHSPGINGTQRLGRPPDPTRRSEWPVFRRSQPGMPPKPATIRGTVRRLTAAHLGTNTSLRPLHKAVPKRGCATPSPCRRARFPGGSTKGETRGEHLSSPGTSASLQADGC